MNKWLKDGTPSKLPCYSSHNLGVGGIVLNHDHSKVLVIKEKMEGFNKIWKFPGGLVDEDETLEKAAIREVKEETNIDANMVGVLGFREMLNFRFG